MASSDPHRMKLLCSFGGKILFRPGDGSLRYVGGHTRILYLRRSSSTTTTTTPLSELLNKIATVSAVPISAVKYQLPGEDLDALITITTQEDLDNMIEEFDRISGMSPGGSARMRIFLFSPPDSADSGEVMIDTGQSYTDAVNGMSPSILSQDSCWLGFFGDEALSSGKLKHNQGKVEVSLEENSNNGDGGSTSSNINSNNDNNRGFYHQPLNPFPPLSSTLIQNMGNTYIPPLRPILNQDCQMCQKSLPHAHSDMLVNDHPNGNGNGNGLGTVQVLQSCQSEDPIRLQASLRMEPLVEAKVENEKAVNANLEIVDCSRVLLSDCSRGQALLRVDVESELKVESRETSPTKDPLGNYEFTNGVSHPHEKERQAYPNGEALDPAKVLHPQREVESKVDNLTPSQQFGAYGSFQMLMVPQSYDKVQAPLRLDVESELKVESRETSPTKDQFGANGFTNGISHPHEKERQACPNGEALESAKVLHPQREVESKVDNLAPSQQFGAYGFTQMPAIPLRVQAPLRVDIESELKVEDRETSPTKDQFGAYGFTNGVSLPHEKERLGHTNGEALDSAKVLHPPREVEPEVDNMTPSSQCGFTKIPSIPQSYDNQRLHINSNEPTVIGFSGVAQATYAVFAHPSQYHFAGSFQPLSQDVLPPIYMVKQDVAVKQFGSVSSVQNGNFQLAEPPSKISASEISYDYIRPINGMKAGLHVNTFDPSGMTENLSTAATINFSAPTSKPEHSTMIVENNHSIRPQVGGDALFLHNGIVKAGIVPEGNVSKPMNQLPPSSSDLNLGNPPNSQAFRPQVGHHPVYFGNGFIASGIFPEGSFVRAINQMPPLSLDFTRVQTLQHAELGQVSTVMANNGPLFSYNQEMRVQSEDPNERLLVMPSYSSSITPAYNINAVNLIPFGELKDVASWFHPDNHVLNHVATPLNGNAQIHYANSRGTNGRREQFQGPTSSELLFCNQDPCKVMGNMQVVPPTPKKVVSKEFVVPRDQCTENHVVYSKGSDAPLLLEEGGLQHMQNSTNKELSMDPVRIVQGEEHNKHESQDLVVSVPLPSIPLPSIPSPHERKEADLPSNKENGLDEANALSQGVAAVTDHKTDKIEADKKNFGFTMTDDIGHLQIIKNNDLEEGRELSSGTFGTVYHGKWRGSDVAIRRINDRCFSVKPSEEERMRADFWNEACMLADLHHPNVVAFYGVVLDGHNRSFATVTEFMVNGSLRHALQKNDKTLDKRKRLLIAMDVAFGMEYLHGKNLIHFDLKSDNLLIKLRDPQRPICKVADLGLSKVKCQTLISGGVRRSLPWMAPELLNGSSSLVSEKVDVFSFGIVMWELLTGEEPYADMHYGAIIGGIMSNTLRPPVPESCDAEWRMLMEQCWSGEPSKRPSFTEIASRLRSMAASLPPNC